MNEFIKNLDAALKYLYKPEAKLLISGDKRRLSD
jgi:hypothetical protein